MFYTYQNISSLYRDQLSYTLLQYHDHDDAKATSEQVVTGMLSTDERNHRLPEISQAVFNHHWERSAEKSRKDAKKSRKDLEKYSHRKHKLDIEKMPEVIRQNFHFEHAAAGKANGYFGYWGKKNEWVLLEMFDTASCEPSSITLFLKYVEELKAMYEKCKFMQQGQYLDCIEDQSKFYLITSYRVGQNIKNYCVAISDKET